ncbi:hypothetical protein ACIHAA_16360 [Streptomyces sp. NPDC052040]|uniref:hypothetical protein n=1 Tax=Streptomyces sp. NPDC052040 TaxID=3365682 RepID=UPI0037D09A9D
MSDQNVGLGSFPVRFSDSLVVWLVNLLAASVVKVPLIGGQVALAAVFTLAAAVAVGLMEMFARGARGIARTVTFVDPARPVDTQDLEPENPMGAFSGHA